MAPAVNFATPMRLRSGTNVLRVRTSPGFIGFREKLSSGPYGPITSGPQAMTFSCLWLPVSIFRSILPSTTSPWTRITVWLA